MTLPLKARTVSDPAAQLNFEQIAGLLPALTAGQTLDQRYPRLVPAATIVMDGPHTVTFTSVPNASQVAATFTTNQASWTSAVPLGALSLTSGSNSSLLWTYSYGGSNSWTITAVNNGGATQSFVWVGFVVGV